MSASHRPMLASSHSLTRRAVLRGGTLALAALGAGRVMAASLEAVPKLRIGLLTDLHYGDKDPVIGRYYRETLDKLDEAVDFFNDKKPNFVVELGDLIDSAPTLEKEIDWLDTIEKHYAKLSMPRHYVLGNHCVWNLTKAEFQAHTGMGEETYFALDTSGIRFLFLDGCFRKNGTPYERHNSDWRESLIPRKELAWLQAQLQTAPGPVIVFAHQRLDKKGVLSSLNAEQVRKLFEASGKVAAVFQGHSHKNDYQHIRGIHYVTLVAMIEGSGKENSGYAMLDIMPDLTLHLHGFRQQLSREWAK